MELIQYLNVLRKWLWLIVLGTLLASSTAYVVSINTQPVYEAAATLLLEQTSSQIYNLRLVSVQWEPLTYAELIPQLLPETAARLGLDKIEAGNVSVDTVRDTRVVKLRVRDMDPHRAAEIANTIPLVFTKYTEELLLGRYAESKATLRKELDRLETDIEATQSRIEAIGEATTVAQKAELTRLETILAQHRYNYGQLLASYEQVHLAEMQAKGSLVIFREATVPSSPVLPRTRQNTLLAAVAGAMLAVGVAFLMEYLDDTLKTPEDVARVLELVTLGSIAHLQSGRRGGKAEPLMTAAHPRSPVSEAFRVLRTNIQYAGVDRPMRRLLVTSPGPSDGKSFLAANLAIVFAQAGQSVVLVDSDLRRPTLHHLFDLSNSAGLTNSLLSEANPGLGEWLLPTPVERLRLLASGPLPPNPSELLGSQRMGQFIEHLAQEADVVIFDSPPVLAVTDAAVLSQRMDGVLLAVQAGGTREREARRAQEELARVNSPVLGAVLNKIPIGRRGEYGYYYYRHYYGETKDEGGRRKAEGGRRKDEG